MTREEYYDLCNEIFNGFVTYPTMEEVANAFFKTDVASQIIKNIKENPNMSRNICNACPSLGILINSFVWSSSESCIDISWESLYQHTSRHDYPRYKHLLKCTGSESLSEVSIDPLEL